MTSQLRVTALLRSKAAAAPLQLRISAEARSLPGHVQFIVLKHNLLALFRDEICNSIRLNAVPPLILLLYSASLLDFVQNLDFHRQVECMILVAMIMGSHGYIQSLKCPTVSRAYHHTNSIHDDMTLCTTKMVEDTE